MRPRQRSLPKLLYSLSLQSIVPRREQNLSQNQNAVSSPTKKWGVVPVPRSYQLSAELLGNLSALAEAALSKARNREDNRALDARWSEWRHRGSPRRFGRWRFQYRWDRGRRNGYRRYAHPADPQPRLRKKFFLVLLGWSGCGHAYLGLFRPPGGRFRTAGTARE